MNRKGIEKGKKSSNDLVMIVMAAMVVMTAMTAFIPTAAAAGSVTDFTITAADYSVNATTGYNITVNTTGYATELTINITLPAGYTVNGTKISSSNGEELARVDIYEDTGYYGNATFTINGTDKVDVVSRAGELTATKTVTVNYSPSASNTINASVVSTSLTSTVVVPAANVGGTNGSVNASITLPSGHNITNVSISIGEFVKNPADAKTYTFSALVNSVEVTDTVTVTSGVTVEIPLQAGWNMVSLPVNPTDPSVSSVFAEVTMYGASVYEYGTGGYAAVTTVEPKKGYWVNSAAAKTITVTGSSITNTIYLQAGWNMVGLPVTPTDPSVSSVFAEVTMYGASVYEYGTGGYAAVTTVEPKKGYWVNSAAAKTITVTGSPVTS